MTSVNAFNLKRTPRALLSVSDLHLMAGRKSVLSGISFHISPGEWLALAGSAGAGKSALLNAVTKPLKLRHGSLKMQASPLAFVGNEKDQSLPPGTLEASLRRHLSYLPPNLRAAELAMLLESFQLWEVRREEPDALSSGQRAGFSLALALSQKPELLVIDNVSDALDPLVSRRFWELLEKRRSQGVGCLYSTRRLEEAERADRVLLLEKGRSIGYGTPDELKAMASPDVLEVETLDPASVKTLLHPFEVIIEERAHGFTFSTREGQEAVARLLREGYGAVRTVTLRRPTLTDAWEQLRLRVF